MINDVIRDVMINNRKTIDDVARMTGYSHKLISDIVLKDVTPRTEEAYRILNCMNVDLGELLR